MTRYSMFLKTRNYPYSVICMACGERYDVGSPRELADHDRRDMRHPPEQCKQQ